MITRQPVRETAVLQRLPPYVFVELDRLKLDARERGLDVIDLGIGSPDLPVAPAVLEALRAASHEHASHGYPSFRGVPRFVGAVGSFMASRFGVEVDPNSETLALSGVKEGVAQLLMALCEPGDVVLVPSIYYPVYARAAWLAGADVRWVPMRADNGFVLDLDALAPADLASARILIVNYPNNPTGARVDLAFFEHAVAFAHRHNLLLVSDLAYSELTFGGTRAPSALEADPGAEVTVEFHSFSKTFSMAGFRLGFAVGNRKAIDALAAYRTNVGYGTPTSIQLMGAYALDHRANLVPPNVAAYRSRRDAFVSALRSGGWNVDAPAAAMYLWLPVPEGIDGWTWVKTLMFDYGIVVTPGAAFGAGGEGYFRVSLVRDEATLVRAAAAIAAGRCRVLSNHQSAP